MTKLTKNKKAALELIDRNKVYPLDEAVALIKKATTTKFDASVDIDARLGVDPRKANQMVRGSIILPHVRVKPKRFWFYVHPTRKRKPKKQVPIMSDWMTMWIKSKAVG